MTPSNHRDPVSGPGLFHITPDDPDDDRWWLTDRWSLRKLAGKHRQPGSLLISWAGWLLGALGAGLLFVSFAAQYVYIFAARHQRVASMIEALMFDLGMIIFSLLALGLARAGKPARAERVLILACAAGSAGMCYAAADDASPRSVIAYTAAPIFLAVVVDRVITVIRRHVLADQETSPWMLPGRALLSCCPRCRSDRAVHAALRTGRPGDRPGPAADGPRRCAAARRFTRARPSPGRHRRPGRRRTRCCRCTGNTSTTATGRWPLSWPPIWARASACSQARPARTSTPS